MQRVACDVFTCIENHWKFSGASIKTRRIAQHRVRCELGPHLKRCDAVRRGATRCDAMRRDATRCDATRGEAMRCDAMRCDAMRRDARRREATRFYQRPRKLPMFCNVSEHTIGVTPCDATQCDASKSWKASVGLFIARVTLPPFDVSPMLCYDVVMTTTQIKSHCNALGVCTLNARDRARSRASNFDASSVFLA